MATSKRTSRKPAPVEQEAAVAPVEQEGAAAPVEQEAAIAHVAQPAAGLKPQDLARFLGLGDANPEQMATLLSASRAEAEKFIGQAVPDDKQTHTFNMGVLHLAAKFYAAGNSQVETDADIPSVCRYLFVLVRRELSGSAQ